MIERDRIAQLEKKVETLERLVAVLLHISRETEDFWPYTDKEEQQMAAEFYDLHRVD